MAYETISNVPLMQTSPEERALYMQLQANNKKKAKLANMLKQYRTNPGQFSADQRMFLEQQAMEAGLPMPDTQTNAMKVLGKGAASALDTAMFGLLPNELYTPLNQAERMATNVGGIAGLFAGGPAALGAGLFRGAAALPRFARAGLMKGMGQSGYRNLAQKGGIGQWLGGGTTGGNFMRGGTTRVQNVAKPNVTTSMSGSKFVKPATAGSVLTRNLANPKHQASLREYLIKNGRKTGKDGKVNLNYHVAQWARKTFGKADTNPKTWGALSKFLKGSNTPYNNQYWARFMRDGKLPGGGGGGAIPRSANIPFNPAEPTQVMMQFPQQPTGQLSLFGQPQPGGLLNQATGQLGLF